MPVPVKDLKLLLQSTRPEATLDTEALRGALPVVTRDDPLDRVGGWSVDDRDLDEAAATLSSAVDNRGG